MNPIGIHGETVAQALGIRQGTRAVLLNAPAGFVERMGGLPPGVKLSSSLGPVRCDLIVCFVTVRRLFEQRVPALRRGLAQGGTLWVAWPARGGPSHTDVNERVVREVARAAGMSGTDVFQMFEWAALRLA